MFRPDILVSQMLNSIAKMLGIKSTMSVSTASIKQLVDESKAEEPILIVASSGADPSGDIKEYANRNKKEYIELSIGKGQEKHTLLQVKQAAEGGKWICIKNVHLAPHWLTSLKEEFKITQLGHDFRLWMICDSDAGFSTNFINSCTKVIFEPPVGVKNKIRHFLDHYANILQKKHDFKYLKPHISLFILHAIIQERRTYIPQGWCKWYDFGEADFKTALDILHDILKTNTSSSIDWPILRGLCEKIAYGGRIDYVQDFSKLEELLLEFFDANILNSRWSPLDLPIVLTNSSDINDYATIINSLPDGENPEILGLSTTTNISKDIIFCRNLLRDLRSKYFNIEESQSYEKRIKPILNLWKKLVSVTTVMKTFDKLKLRQEEETNKPWSIFKLSEIILAGKLFNVSIFFTD